jgi:hypothetical protein
VVKEESYFARSDKGVFAATKVRPVVKTRVTSPVEREVAGSNPAAGVSA